MKMDHFTKKGCFSMRFDLNASINLEPVFRMLPVQDLNIDTSEFNMKIGLPAYPEPWEILSIVCKINSKLESRGIIRYKSY